ncbi:autotransporter domain-containing protein [Acetobacter fabarum]|uniref:autotransporter outer membrane beta-barrel domain-containing protein n=1 Tax=Acetobacter fabarum TaxID=483199 RepID=UPI00312B5AF1
MIIENYGTMGLYGNNISESTIMAAANTLTTIGECSTSLGCDSNTGSMIQNTTFTNNGISTVNGGVNLSGSTIINNAVLDLSNTALTAGGDITNSGTITMSGNNSVQSSVENNGTLNVVSGVSALSGALGGHGAMSVTGASVTLSGNGTYMGSIAVQDGVLDVSGAIPNATVDARNGATIQGNGTIGTTTLASGSVISPEAGGSIGTLTVNGNLTVEDGAKYIADGRADTVIGTVALQRATLNRMASDLVSVTGSVNLMGGDVSFSSLSGKVAPGQVYRLLTAGNGVSGQFSSLTTPYVFLSSQLFYSSNAVDVLMTRNAQSYSAVAATRNQFMTGIGVDGLSASNDVALALDGLSTDQVRPALNNLSGEVHASARTALVQDSFFVRQSALDRLDTADCDGSIADSTLHTASLKTGRKDGGCLADQPVIWGEAYGSLGHNSGNGNAANMNHSTAGFIMGMDTLVAQTWRVGGMFGYGRSMFNVGSGRGSSGHSNNVTAGGYAGTHWGGLNLRLGVAYTWNMLSITRNVAVANFTNHLSSDYLGGTAQAYGELGYKFHIGHGMVEPFGNLAYINQHTNGYNEQGGVAALHGKGMDTGVTFSTFGIKGSSLFHVGKLALVPHGSLAYRHAFGLSTSTTHEMFRQARYGDMDVAGVPLSVNAAVVDTGLTAKLTDRIDVGLSYTGQYGNRSVDSGARAQARFQF